MDEQNDVSGVKISSIPRSDLKIEGEKPKSCEFDERKESSKIRNVNSIPNSERRSGLDLNTDTVSSILNDNLSSSVCDKPSSMLRRKDPMKLWEAMKQNGFLSSSCFVSSSSSHGGIPIPRKRIRKIKNIQNNATTTIKKRKIEISKKEEMFAAPSGLLNELNLGIINHVRNKKQVLSIIRNIVNSEKDSRNFNHSSTRQHSNIADGEFSEANNTVLSRFQMSSKFSENVSSLTSEEDSNLNYNSVLTVKAATVASQWLELLHQDIKGRVSALRRSKKRVRSVITTELPFLIMKEFKSDQENEPNLLLDDATRDSSKIDIHRTRWMVLFNQLEQSLSEEEKQLETWLNQVRDLQSLCDQGLQHLSLSSDSNFLKLGMPLDFSVANSLISDKDLVVRASAASIYSTFDFIATKKNITCT